MTIGESFRKAYEVVSKNWPLVLINMATTVVVMVLFFLFVMLPLMSITGGQGFHYHLESPSQLKQFLSGVNLQAVLAAVGLFVLWLLIASVVGVYVYAGAVGVMKEALLKAEWKFSLKEFFRQANGLFWPVTGYIGVVFLVGIGVLVAWVVFFLVVGLVGSAFKSVPQGGMAVVVSVLGVFLFIGSILLMLALMLIFASLASYGTSAIAFRDTGVMGALKRAFKFLWSNPRAFWGYVFSIGILWVVAIVLGIGGLVLQIIPVVGLVLALPYNIFSWSVQIYAAYWSTAVAMGFYWSGRQTGPEGPSL